MSGAMPSARGRGARAPPRWRPAASDRAEVLTSRKWKLFPGPARVVHGQRVQGGEVVLHALVRVSAAARRRRCGRPRSPSWAPPPRRAVDLIRQLDAPEVGVASELGLGLDAPAEDGDVVQWRGEPDGGDHVRTCPSSISNSIGLTGCSATCLIRLYIYYESGLPITRVNN